MKPREIRERIFEDHALLRERLEEIEALNERFVGGSAEVGSELRERGAALYEMFDAHLSLEDENLAPVLRTIPEKGKDLAARLAREHREQRELLHFLLGRLEEQNRPTSVIANELQGFSNYLKLEMSHEESAILSHELLQN
jgi:hemerythrin-like domain-containing protein